MEGISEKEKAVLIGKLLMPVATLNSIAEEYGITRQRVGAIFSSSIGKQYSEVKQDLISEKFRCVVCGRPIPMSKVTGKGRKKRNHCSDECAKIAASIDLSQLAICKYDKCKCYFFVNRNWKFTKKKEFCSIDHYLAHINQGGRDEALSVTK